MKKPVIVILVVAGCFLLAACSSNLTQFPVSTSQSVSTSTVSSPSALSSTVPASGVVPHEIIAAGDPMVGTGKNSTAVAWRSGGETPAALAAFPDEAQTALRQLQAQDGSDLYLAIYGGLQPSSGYEVKIVSLDKLDNRLQVSYQIAGPLPGQGAAAVMTHPYVVARIADATIQPADVIFVEQKPAR